MPKTAALIANNATTRVKALATTRVKALIANNALQRHDKYKSAASDSGTRIAVVGSSGNLLYRKHGAEIDAHDVIFRINAPLTNGFEEDVGHELTIRFATDLPIQNADENHQIRPTSLPYALSLAGQGSLNSVLT